MPENGRPVANFFFCGCVLALTLWNNIKLSEENEFTKNYSNNVIDDSEAKSLPQSDAESLQFRAPNPQNTQSNWVVIENTTECLGLSNISNKGIKDLKQLLSEFNKKSRLKNLTLENIVVTWKDFIIILELVWQTSVEYFNIHNMTQLDNIEKQHFNYVDTSLKALTIDKISITDLYFTQSDLYLVFSEMNILALTISDSKMLHMLCPSTISPFWYLSFANNDITDLLFEDCKTLVHLETLILRKNQFRELSKVSSMTREMISLKYLDMSQNPLKCDEEQKKHCSWTETLVKLNLSSNKLTHAVFRCLPLHVQILDLQNNQISTIPKEITKLEALSELNIAFNRLTDLPGCRHFSALEFLNIEMNQILTPSSDFFQSCQNIRELKAGLNPFKCSCELQDFINHAKQGPARLGGWPEFYVCEYPEGWKGTQLKDFHLSEIACNTILLLVTVLIITVVLVALVSFLCIYFDAPWYLKMMWQWTQTKRRVWNSYPEELPSHLQFHAFISYSEHDSLWVKNDLIPNLEREEGSIQLCVHERNFIPGKSIVENIINCIEKSYKSIFVLSPNFVQSEWCHYELYFAHHKLFSESSNSLILILLDPIPQYIIPARYHKLKALMAKRTYLEWPKEKSKQRLFWANLRAAINLNLPVSAERS